MSWRDQLRPAAFKGVPFEYDEATDTEPRRWVAHESAGADGAAHEALPLHPLKVRLTAYLIGPDHLDQARRLREALKAPEAGTLVHPWLGSVRVVCLDWSQRHTTREGGVSAFQLEFAADDAAAARPVAAIDHAATVEAARESTLTALSEAFQGSFTVADQPGWVVEDSADLLGDLTDRVEAALAPLTDGLAAAQALADAALDLRQRALGLLSLPGDTLGDLADALLGLAPLGRLRALVGTVRQLLALSLDADLLGLLGLDGLFGGEITAGRWASPAATTPSRAVQGTNRRALADLWSAAVAVEAAALATRVGYDSSAEVLATRDQVLGALDQVARTTSDDTVYRAVTTLRADVARALAAEALRAPQLATHTPAATLPSLVVAHHLYGDDPAGLIDRAGSIVSRNHVRHPGAVPGGQALEVLT